MQLSNGALVLLGVVGGLYLLYTWVWFSWANYYSQMNSAVAEGSGSSMDIGGVFGIGVGYLGTLVVGKLSFDMILIPSPTVTAGAFLISVILGIIFGLYPAIKASGLQPVDALRAE